MTSFEEIAPDVFRFRDLGNVYIVRQGRRGLAAEIRLTGVDHGEITSESVEGSIEVHLEAGDALVFVDAICHGAVPKRTDGERRIVVYRYGPSWGNFRHGYQPSEAFLNRLTPEQRQIVQPQKLIPREIVVKPT